MPLHTLQNTFTGGEISQALRARIDLSKYNQSCKLMRNFIVRAEGGAEKRAGFYFLNELPGEAVLIPFVFNSTQTYCLAFGEKWVMVANHDGLLLAPNGSPYKIFSPYTLEQAKQISFEQSADVIFIAVHGVKPYKLSRYGNLDWRFEALDFMPTIAAPSSITATFVNEAKDSSGAITPAQRSTPYTYYVTALDEIGKEGNAVKLASPISGPASNNWNGGDYIKLDWSAVSGATEYRVYKSSFGGNPGLIATVGALTFNDMNHSPSISEGLPEFSNLFETEDDDGNIVYDYPGVVGIYAQRLIFASTPNRPQTIWMSKAGDYQNFAKYTPLAEDSPIEKTLANRQMTMGKWMVELIELVFGTDSSEIGISGTSATVVTDSSISASARRDGTAKSYCGSSLNRALPVLQQVLFIDSSGERVRSLSYSEYEHYMISDLSALAEHLFKEQSLIDWTYQKNPNSIIWCVRNDGILLALTYIAEHQVIAWSQHRTEGDFKSICSIPNGYDFDLFTLVVRDERFFLERYSHNNLVHDYTGSNFVDSALTYRGVPVSELYGLEHLEGKFVSIWIDGAIHPQRQVLNGKVSLDYSGEIITVGLPFIAELETMPIELNIQGQASISLKKQINKVLLKLDKSLGLSCGINDFEKMQEIKWRNDEPYGIPPKAYTGEKEILSNRLADNNITVCLRSTSPAPVTVLSIVTECQVIT